MTLTALVGAFLALVPAVKRDKPKRNPVIDEVCRLRVENERLEAQLSDADRNLTLQEMLTQHWRGEAMRIARLSRQAREEIDRARQQREMQQHQQLAHQMQMNSLAQQAQAYQGLPPGMPAQYNQQALAQQANGYNSWCNCVPSRSQVWAAQQGE